MDPLDIDKTLERSGLGAGMRVLGDRFELLRVLGRGGMGVVWLARDRSLDLDVALKFLPEPVFADEAARKDLRREARRALQLAHHHIVKVYDFLEDGQAAGISMEFVDGATLNALRARKATDVLEADEIGEWIRQACEALEYAHAKAGVVHRDLKPSNLMVDARGDLKICDFGIARAMSDSFTRTTGRHAASGTLPYMSPQQVLGETASVADDIYALGATIYELLTGKPPFYSGAIELQVSSKVPPPMRRRREELGVTGASTIPGSWERTVAACLEKEPGKRPRSARELWNLLEGRASAAEADLRRRSEAQRKAAEAVRRQAEAERMAWERAEREKAARRKKVLVGALAIITLVVGGALWAWSAGLLGTGGKTAAAPTPAPMPAATPVAQAPEPTPDIPPTPVPTPAFTPLPTPPPPVYGQVVLTSDPSGAEVYGPGNRYLGKTRLELEEMKPGPATFRVEKEGYESGEVSVAVTAGEKAENHVSLVESTGSVRLVSEPPGARVEVDGKSDTTPATFSGLHPGSHKGRISMEGYEPRQIEFDVAAQESRTHTWPLVRAGGTPTNATKDRPFENSLGMKFVPAGTPGVLFCIWETRVKDYGAYARENSGVDDSWRDPVYESMKVCPSEDCPVVNVSWEDAKKFCAWLTEKERKEGKIGREQDYRLPTDAEWSIAVGLGRESGSTPQEKDGRAPGYPWGGEYPPTGLAGNYADETSGRSFSRWYHTISGYNDGYATTSPVGSFSANKNGLYDIGGNAWEWCEDFYDGHSGAHVPRGASWFNSSDTLLSSCRNGAPLFSSGFGFRCVLGKPQPHKSSLVFP